MQSWMEVRIGPLTQTAVKALKENVAHNRSGLPPFRLPQVAQQIIATLGEFLGGADAAVVHALGEKLGAQGLGLRSLLAVSRALGREAMQRITGTSAEDLAPNIRLQEYLTLLIDGLSASEMSAIARQRDEMQIALERAVKNREDELRQVIQELSTPVMPLYDQILVLPLIGNIDNERASKITERLLEEVTQRRARIIIIDITGVPNIDTNVAAALMRTARAVQLLGARPILVGIRAELARVLTQLGVDLGGLITLANLQSGIEWALRQQGLSVQRLSGAAGGAVSGSSSASESSRKESFLQSPSFERSRDRGN